MPSFKIDTALWVGAAATEPFGASACNNVKSRAEAYAIRDVFVSGAVSQQLASATLGEIAAL